MTPREIQHEITSLSTFLLGEQLAIAYQAPIVRTYGSLAYVSSSWDSHATVEDEEPEDEDDTVPFACIREYLRFLRSGQYTLVLFDGALIQVAYSFDRGNLKRHRICYYPCPVDLDFRGSDYVDFYEIIEATIETDSLERIRLRSPLRFDFDIDAAKTDHPASHLHLNREATRIPVYGPISIGHFARFISRHFYYDVWKKHETLQGWSQRYWAKSIGVSEEQEIHFTCRQPV